jgi:hypothetical protein
LAGAVPIGVGSLAEAARLIDLGIGANRPSADTLRNRGDGRDVVAELKQRWSAGLIGENEVGGRQASAILAWCGRFDAVGICGLSGSRSPTG